MLLDILFFVCVGIFIGLVGCISSLESKGKVRKVIPSKVFTYSFSDYISKLKSERFKVEIVAPATFHSKVRVRVTKREKSERLLRLEEKANALFFRLINQ